MRVGLRLTLLLLVTLGTGTLAIAQGTYVPNVPGQFFDANGDPCTSCALHTYTAGTTTNLPTYSDEDLLVANANPIVLDAAGRATIFLSQNSYRFVLRDSADAATLWDRDNIIATPSAVTGVSNTGDITFQVDTNNDGSNSFIFQDGTGTTRATLNESGDLQIDDDLTIGDATEADKDLVWDGNAQDFYVCLDDSADDLVVGLGAACGTTRAFAIDAAQVTTFFQDPIIAGTTPRLTVGDAGAEDADVLWDGNAQDYYLCLDDSDDALLIGLGSVCGTTPALGINENRVITLTGSLANTSLRVLDTDATHTLTLAPGSNLTANRTLTVTTGDAAVTANITPTAAGTFWRSDGTNWAGSTLVLPNAATVNRIPYATGANTWGESANLSFNGTLFAVGGFGSHAFSAGGTGGQTVRVRNTTAGATNFASAEIGHDTDPALVGLRANSTTFTTTTYNYQNGAALVSGGAGGLSLVAADAAGVLRFYAGGSTEIVRIRPSGLTIYNATTPAAGVHGETQTLADAATLNLSDNVEGFLFVNIDEDNAGCMWHMNGTADTTTELIDSATICSAAAGTALSINVYHDGAVYRLQNLRGASRDVNRVFLALPF